MKVDLLELLRSKEIAHPTRISSVMLSGSKLVISLTGCAWWRDEGNFEEARYEFHFEDVSDGLIDALLTSQGWDEALEYFSVLPLAAANWAQPSICQIFCSGALRDPLALYAKLERYLAETAAFREPKDFLNGGQSKTPLATFAQIASENSFLLACCPEEMCAILTTELSRQDVPHNVVRCGDNRDHGGLHVQLDNSNFLCGSASAILPD